METIRFNIAVEVKFGGDDVISVSAKVCLPRRPGRPTKAESLEMAPALTFVNSGRLIAAVEFVKAYLDVQRPSALLFIDAEEAGHAKKTIYRAAKILGVIKRPIGHGYGQEWVWSLPKEEALNEPLAHI